jgi:hypothetical protein
MMTPRAVPSKRPVPSVWSRVVKFSEKVGYRNFRSKTKVKNVLEKEKDKGSIPRPNAPRPRRQDIPSKVSTLCTDISTYKSTDSHMIGCGTEVLPPL